ncbi:MAG TPA: hypothetical protein P5509_04245 [Bacteroidales bacterium]|nr:hypothetical protein [Bacteroidales bacterium]
MRRSPRISINSVIPTKTQIPNPIARFTITHCVQTNGSNQKHNPINAMQNNV